MQLSQGKHSEWYTPKVYIDAVRATFGGVIDCDPYSCYEANKTVKAVKYGTKESPLTMWLGSTFVNPPYSDYRGQANDILGEVLSHYDNYNIHEAICLVSQGALNQKNAQQFMRKGCVCLTDHRIKFWDGILGKVKNAPQQNNAFLYIGPNHIAFEREFNKFGVVLRPL